MTLRASVIVAVAAGDDSRPTLAALDAQDPDAPAFEVLAAGTDVRGANGPEPGPPEFRARWVGSVPGSVGEAWNAAAKAAGGDILIFLRAGVVPCRRLVRVHVDAHASGAAPCLAVGQVTGPGGGTREAAHAADFGEATLSIPRGAFERGGGFSAGLRWGADIELRHRLAGCGVQVLQLQGLTSRRPCRTGRRAAAERVAAGRGNVELYRHSPALLPSLELGAFQSDNFLPLSLRRALLALGGPPVPRAMGAVLPRGRWRQSWERFVHRYDFWRGAFGAISDRATRRALARAPVILLYHALGQPEEAPGWYVVPVRRFARQMAWLAARRYHVLSLGELLACRARFELPPARSVVITFDDGYADNVGLAYPILRRRGFPATFFLVSGCLGGRNEWDRTGALAGRAMMSAVEARELLVGGMEVGAHTRRHPVLPDLTPAALDDEVRGARAELERHLGQPVRTFAYPFGRLDEKTVAAVGAAGFEGACCSRSGVNDPFVPPLLLRRVEVRGSDSVLDFARAVRRGRAVRRPRP